MGRAGCLALGLLMAISQACGAQTDAPVPARPATEREEAVPAEPSISSEAPRVEARYQERIDEAWGEATAGENPAATCAGVKGRAASAPAGLAAHALVACSIDIPARYFLSYVDRVETGERTCIQLMTEVVTKLPSMTISAEPLRDLAARGDEAEPNDGAAAAAATAVLAGGAASGDGVGDPQRTVKDRISERVTAVCPEEAVLILR